MSIAALAALSPLIGFAALAIKLSSPGPVLFRQQRMGLGGRSFTLVKLRTMQQSNAGPGVTARGDTRVTRVGRVLRRTKIDELPELWNLFRGDMSLVGPRPEVLEYVDFDNPDWRDVLHVRPGLTDPITLRLRNEEDLLDAVTGDRESFYRTVLLPYKLRGNLEYLQRRTWCSDVRVIAQTIGAVFMLGHAPAPTPQSIADAGVDLETQGVQRAW
ncbi:MAG: sugar transferase [Thermoleophilia bacterium]